MLSTAFSRSQLRRRSLAIVALALPSIVASCADAEAKTRKRIAGDYALEYDAGPETPFYVRQVLSLRLDGRWVRTSHSELSGTTTDSPPDSGTFRIQGVTLILRSLVESGVPMRYTIGGDTLFNVNTTRAKAITGYDIGEEKLVRVR